MGKSGPFFLHVYDVVRSWCLDSSLPFFHLISRWAILRVRAGAEFLFSAQLSSDGFGYNSVVYPDLGFGFSFLG